MYTKVLSLFGLSAIMAFANLTSTQAFADGSFIGLGVVVQSEKKSIQIVDIYENSPASRAGIIPGEWISAVDGKSTANKKLKEVTQWLRGDGKEGSKVTLTVQDEKRATNRDLMLTRELITFKCIIEGMVNLQFSSYGNPYYGYVSGSVGGYSVFFQVNGSYVTWFYRGRYLNLNFDNDTFGNIHLAGWVNGQYIDWRGSANNIYGNQSCIRE